MDIKEAYLIVKKDHGKDFLLECVDVGDRWAFFFHHEKINRDEIMGGGYDAVDKHTGDVSDIGTDPNSMFDIIHPGKQVRIDQFE